MATVTASKTHKKGLGKGLSALMGEEYSQSMSVEPPRQKTHEGQGGMSELLIDQIQSGKYQPRQHFNEEYLHELADSIEKNGVMQPIIVRPLADKANHYEIVAGERRWRAAKLAGIDRIPALVRDIHDQQALELALVENVQRQDLSPLEEAAGYQRLIDEFTYTQEELAQTVGKSRSHITNLLRLLGLPDVIKAMLEKEELTMGHARALLTADKPVELAKKIIKEELNVRQAELLAKGEEETPPSAKPSKNPHHPKRKAVTKDNDILALEENLSQNLGLKVRINDYGGQQGDVIISYQSLTQLDDILRRLSDHSI